jgi:hypothetical protein
MPKPAAEPQPTAVQAYWTQQVLAPLWKSARRWSAAIALALFPVLFIVDVRVETSLSPVLPGLVGLAVLILLLPFLLMELQILRFRRKDAAWQARKVLRSTGISRTAFWVSATWVIVWFAVGT